MNGGAMAIQDVFNSNLNNGLKKFIVCRNLEKEG
jgi:hypothetical protein